METIKFKNDTATRRRLFDPESFAHPAKGQTGMGQLMIERYSKPGDLVLDPMAGTGVTMLAALMGRNVVCVELEPHFVEPMRRSWEKMRQNPMLGFTMGSVLILQGDARALPLGRVDAILSSPPYEGGAVGQDAKTGERQWERFQEALASGDVSESTKKRWKVGQPPADSNNLVLPRYTRPQVDVALTSPPCEEAERRDQSPYQDGRVANMMSYSYRSGVHGSENIGNLRSGAYWSAMAQVYGECWRVLRPGGILALVLKGFTRDSKYVDLPAQTEALLLAAGWLKHDEWRRELWSLSFWRILQKRRDPAAFDDRLKFETVLAFKKPEHGGDTNKSSLPSTATGPLSKPDCL